MSHYPAAESRLPTSVLVTGGTGFIGRTLVAALQQMACEVTVLVCPGEAVPSQPEVTFCQGDITDIATLSGTLQSVAPQLVYHLAAIGTANPNLPVREAVRVNLGGAVNLLEAVRVTQTVERLVMVGTSYEYGSRSSDDGLDPFNAYSASKVAAWAFARAAYNTWRTPVVWVRPFQVYGPGQRSKALIPEAIAAALQHKDFPMTRGEQQRDFVFIDDVVRGLLTAGSTADIEGRSLDLGSGELHAIRDVVERIWAKTAARGRILSGALPYRPGEVPAIPADIHRTRLLTGWQAKVTLDQGLEMTIQASRVKQVRAEGPYAD